MEQEHKCETCKKYQPTYDITMTDDDCGGCCSWNDKWEQRKDESNGKVGQ